MRSLRGRIIKRISNRVVMMAAVAALTAGSISPVFLSAPVQSVYAGDTVSVPEDNPDEIAEEPVRELSVDFIGGKYGYSVALYDNTNGLPTAEANAIAQTSDGFVWIGSYSGLIRYDGRSFERFDSAKGFSSVVSLFVDSRKRLWVGTNDAGVIVIDGPDLKKYTKKNGLVSLSVRSIAEDRKGNIYLATTEGLAIVDPKSGELGILGEEKLKDRYIREIRSGGDDMIYGITMNSEVFVLKDKRLIAFFDSVSLGLGSIHAILPDPEDKGNVWLGTTGSEIIYGRINTMPGDGPFSILSKQDTAPLSYINSMEYIDGMLWICSDKGIGFLKGEELRTFDELPLNVAAESMITDYQGNLWFASTQQGVMKVVANRFSDLFERNYLKDEIVDATCVYNGQLIIGTKNNGIIVLHDDRYIVYRLPIFICTTASGETRNDTNLVHMLSSLRVRSLMRDSSERLWVCGFGDTPLVCYDGTRALIFSKTDGLPSDRVRAIYECADGSYAVACTGGLAIIENDVVSRVYDESSGITNTEILTVTENGDHELVVGTDGGGIFIIGKDGSVDHIDTDTQLSSDVVMRVKYDAARDLIWIVTSNSISFMKADHTVTTVNGFPYSNNFDLYENKKEEMWILSSNGIYVVPVSKLLANPSRINAVFYGRENGLPCITTANSYSELTENGDLYISGTTGVAKVNIDEQYDAIGTVRMNVPFIEADGKMIYPEEDGSFVINPDVMRLTIYSYVYNYSLSDPQVTYWLEGFDSKRTTVERSELVPIVYTNLKGGSYTFMMEMKDSTDAAGKSYSVAIVKRHAFVETIWFKLILGVVAIAAITLAVGLYIQAKTRIFLKKEKENRMLVREIVEAFAKVIDMKDKYTNGHSMRVAEYTAMLATELGYDEDTVEKYRNIALMHDIGKIGIPEEVLNKPGKLTDEEYAVIKSHSALGYETLKGISIMPELATGAGSHHERPDGKGYPRGLAGDEIPRVAQIIAVADTFDAMYSNRPYRKRMNFERVVSIIAEGRGTQLAPDVVDAFMRLVDKGLLRDEEDNGGGTTEDIQNIK